MTINQHVLLTASRCMYCGYRYLSKGSQPGNCVDRDGVYVFTTETDEPYNQEDIADRDYREWR